MRYLSKIFLITGFVAFCVNSFANPTVLEVTTKKIVVDGKSKTVYVIEQPNGTWGYSVYEGESFNVIVKNMLNESTVIHWHGLVLPNNQDGVELTQKLIAPHSEYKYNFPLKQSGTYWMHSHFELQEQDFAEAPLIIYKNRNYNSKNDVTMMLQDFSYKSPEAIMHGLTSGDAMSDMGDMKDMPMNNQPQMDLNDVKYDAYLVNYKDLNNPQINYITPGSTVRLRIINGASMSNFWINLGNLNGQLIAIDGSKIKPIHGSKFQIGMGNRLDILVKIPQKSGYFPILAQVEGTKSQTGIILVNNKKIKLPKFSSIAKTELPALNYTQELQATPLNPADDITVAKNPQVIKLVLNGSMKPYVWTINGQAWPKVTPISVKMGNDVIAELTNNSDMAHPMHLHGYRFKVIDINGKKVNGAIQDTVLVQPHTTVKIAFVVDNPGNWLFHCHSLYHMHAGMMTYMTTDIKSTTK